MRKLCIFVIIILASMCVYSQTLPTLSCEFSEFIIVYHSNPENTKNIKVNKTMKIMLGKTTDDTMKLDGTLRATNSTVWKKITFENMETWESHFIGDFGELLTIEHELGANKKPLHGWYKASLISNSNGSTHILLGRCFVE
jgi:hypothetical protein